MDPHLPPLSRKCSYNTFEETSLTRGSQKSPITALTMPFPPYLQRSEGIWLSQAELFKYCRVPLHANTLRELCFSKLSGP
ncbi:unnamed protein product [Knipowitschia caucasica]|uniref:Uncharacterized protein n=1 Tax=Knipowitschia caucasica TaxID=637954 RepID=A0AAV2JWU5_KNICA